MRYVWIISLILSLPSCDDSNESLSISSEGIGSSLARFTITNDFLYIVNNRELISVNIKEPELPAVSNFVQVGDGIETIYPFRNYLLIGSADAMYIYSLAKDPSAPEFLSRFSHWEACDPVIAQGEFAYITLREGTDCRGVFAVNQLDVVDISNPTNPFHVADLAMKHPHGLGISGNKLYVCEGSHGLTQVDITVPSAPKIDSTYTGFHAYDIIAKDNLLIVTGNDGYFQFYITDEGLKQVSKIEFL